MFNWLFKPSCPCDLHSKKWVEERLSWLAEEFDDHAFNGRPLVLPTPQFFPSKYDHSQEAVQSLLEQVCDYMDVSPELIELELFTNNSNLWLVNESGQYQPKAAGTYEDRGNKFHIRIDRNELAEPMNLVGTLAHELSHIRLMGEGRMTGDEFDNEILTDLTTVHFGLGIFLSNTPRVWVSQYSKWPDTDYNKPEYMTGPMFGWALAHLAWFRGESQPPWAKFLNLDARSHLQQGLRYLEQTKDSTYRPFRWR